MKWYEKQKDLYGKNQAQTDAKKTTPSTEDVKKSESSWIKSNEQQNNEVSEPKNDQISDGEKMLDDAIRSFSKEPIKVVEEVMNEEVSATTISNGTVLNGNIEAEGDLIIRGQVTGDIVCHSNLSVYGIVEGSINCNSAYFEKADIQGNITCIGNMHVTESSIIEGDIETDSLLSGGHITGNINVTQGVQFLSTSVIVGDTKASEIQVDRGAMIQGNVSIEGASRK